MNIIFYDSALVLTCSVSIILNIFMLGFLLRWKRKATFWRNKFHDTVTPVEPPTIIADPYDGVKDALEYNWEEWD